MSEFFEGGQPRRTNLFDEKYGDVIMTAESNTVMMNFMYQKGFAKHVGYMTRGEAASVAYDAFSLYNNGIFANSTAFSFDEFYYFKRWIYVPGNFAINMTQMSSITLPDTITNILAGGLRSSGLRRLVLPKHIKSIASRGIQNANLQKLVSLNPTPPTISATGWPTQAQIYVPDAAVDTYKAASIWSDYAAKINPLSDYDGIIINEI